MPYVFLSLVFLGSSGSSKVKGVNQTILVLFYKNQNKNQINRTVIAQTNLPPVILFRQEIKTPAGN
jgi:hypothetical protein